MKLYFVECILLFRRFGQFGARVTGSGQIMDRTNETRDKWPKGANEEAQTKRLVSSILVCWTIYATRMCTGTLTMFFIFSSRTRNIKGVGWEACCCDKASSARTLREGGFILRLL